MPRHATVSVTSISAAMIENANHWEWLAFGIIAALMVATLLAAWRGTQRDEELLGF